jgi:hypothetical protein
LYKFYKLIKFSFINAYHLSNNSVMIHRPPPSNELFAAFTMVSASKVVMFPKNRPIFGSDCIVHFMFAFDNAHNCNIECKKLSMNQSIKIEKYYNHASYVLWALTIYFCRHSQKEIIYAVYPMKS